MIKESLSVAIQGDLGSYHDEAARNYFGETYRPRYCETFDAVFDSVTGYQTDFGLSAVENSLVGSIPAVYDLLRTNPDITIVGEIYLAIHHGLIVLPGTKLEDIRTVYSHPVALGQCRLFLQRELSHAKAHSTHDTAGSVDHIQQLGDPTAAAIAGPNNAARLGLELLRTRIEDNPENYTRFLALGRSEDVKPEDRLSANKTSLLIERLNDDPDDSAPGTLYRTLGCFALNGISLTKVESRPIHGRPWRYEFYLDCATGSEDRCMAAALHGLSTLGAQWRLLGTYRAGRTID